MAPMHLYLLCVSVRMSLQPFRMGCPGPLAPGEPGACSHVLGPAPVPLAQIVSRLNLPFAKSAVFSALS